MTVTFLTPLRSEAVAVLLGRRGTGASVVRTGAGADRARRPPAGAARAIVAGVCGAVTGDLRPGQIIVADRILGYDGTPLPSGPWSASAAALAEVLRGHGLPARTGTLAGAERLVRTAAARADLAERGADAVDLESAGLATAPGVIAVLRAVVDTPGAELLTPATVTGGLRALWALRRMTPLAARWAAEHHPKKEGDHSWASPCARA